MNKLKYYQLAEKDGIFKHLISPSKSIISSMIADDWNFYGYDVLSNIPINPICDNGIIREMTESELLDLSKQKSLSKNIFSKLSIRRAMRELGVESNLDMLLLINEQFNNDWNDAIEIDLSDTITIQAINYWNTENPDNTIDVDTIKLKIAEV